MSDDNSKIRTIFSTPFCVGVFPAIVAFFICFTNAFAASQFDIAGPAGSGSFGASVKSLPNGNIVVTDPSYDAGPIPDVGAVYLYNGATGALISRLTGSTSNDNVGNRGVTVLTNGNYVIASTNWNGTTTKAGAVTFCNGTTGLSGVVSEANSLVGSNPNDQVGTSGVTALTNGNYVVSSYIWNGMAARAGAITFGNGVAGIRGIVSPANSLVGSTANDEIGINGITALSNGNYVVNSRNWDGTAIDVGAVTWGNGTTGITGAVSSANSLVGSNRDDFVGTYGGIIELTNGNYVVCSGSWGTTNVGAVTFANGATGITGIVSPANSLVGSNQDDQVGSAGAKALTNGNYVVTSESWGLTGVGAVTFGNGTTGITGVVSPANSLVGSSPNDSIGKGVLALTNGNYVVISYYWGPADVGAITWGNGITGTIGVVSAANSLVGSTTNDNVGGVRELTNGNYVVQSPFWDGTAVDVGAVTWGNGITGTTGVISPANSLVGSTANDWIGNTDITALTNGNYVVGSQNWGATDFGAVTFGNGTTGITGVVSSANSLVGSTANDVVGSNKVTALTNGNYVIGSSAWDGAAANIGAVTWGNGTTGISGVISEANSLVGATAGDFVGNVTALTNGNYVVNSPNWDGKETNVGAVTWGNGTTGTIGVVSEANSLVGLTAFDQLSNFNGSSGTKALNNGNFLVSSPDVRNNGVTYAGAISYGAGNGGTVGKINAGNTVRGTVSGGGFSMPTSLDTFNETLIVGRPGSNIVTIINPTYTAVNNGNWSAGETWNYGAFNKLHDVYVPNGRTVNLDVVNTVNSLRVDCTGAMTGAGFSAYIIGNIRKDFCAPGAFNYPTGTANGYSPVAANVTALASNPSSLTVKSTALPLGDLNPAISLARNWDLTETGDLTANLTFNYLPTDVNGNQSNYVVFKKVGASLSANACVLPSICTPGTNRISITNVSSFSKWSAGQPQIPIAVSVSISGRVLTSGGSGLPNIIVRLTDADGQTRTVRTSSFGYYRFEEIGSGQDCLLEVRSKQYTFAQQTVAVNGEISGLNLVAQP